MSKKLGPSLSGQRRKRRARTNQEICDAIDPPDLAYTEDLAKRVCEHVANGVLLTEIEKMPGMPSVRDMKKWARDDAPRWRKMYADAWQLSAHTFEEEAIGMLRAIRDNPKASKLDLDKAKELGMQLRWSAEKRNPRDFGYKPATVAPVSITFHTNLNMDPDAPPTIDITPERTSFDWQGRLRELERIRPEALTADERQEMAGLLDAAGRWERNTAELDSDRRRGLDPRALAAYDAAHPLPSGDGMTPEERRYLKLREVPSNVRTADELREMAAFEERARQRELDQVPDTQPLKLTAMVPEDPPEPEKPRRKAAPTRRSDPTWTKRLLPPPPGEA